jgi:hypothetical protein
MNLDPLEELRIDGQPEWKVQCLICGEWTKCTQAIEICPDCKPVDLDGNPLHPQTGIAR